MSQALTVSQKFVGVQEAFKRLVMPQLKDALPATLGLSPERFARMLYTSLRRTPSLLDCTQQSLFAEVMTAAQFGLQIDGVHSALVPYREKGVPTAKLIPMYRGLMDMAMRSGQIAAIYPPHLVFKQDKFSVRWGTDEELIHEPSFETDDLDDMIGAYCACKMLSGEKVFQYVPRVKLDRIRASAKARSDQSPWNTTPDEMYLKTAVRALCKRIPTSSELQEAIARDEILETPGARDPREPEFEVQDGPAVKRDGLDALADRIKPPSKSTQPAPAQSATEAMADEGPWNADPLPVDGQPDFPAESELFPATAKSSKRAKGDPEA